MDYQRSQNQEDSQIEAFEYAPSHEEDISVQLREKVRSQALRLRALEKYRKLCEERIAQLVPSHPFPVIPDHLKMQPMPSSYDLHLTKQKVNRLEQQLSQSQFINDTSSNNGQSSPSPQKDIASKLQNQLFELKKDKQLLEESLRAEILASEEQKTYIEILKQALEAKMEDLGMSGFTPQEFSDYTQARNQMEKIRVESAKLQNTILDQEAYIKRLSLEYKDMEVDCKRLIHEREEIDKQLQDAVEALQIGEDEVKRLEEEKSALLDYADEKAKTEQKIMNDLKEVAEKYNTCKYMYENLIKDFNEEKDKNAEIEHDLETFKAKDERNEKSIKELCQSQENTKIRVEEKDGHLKKLREEIRILTNKNESLSANNSTLADTLKETQNDLDNVQNELDEYIQKVEKYEKNLDNANNQIHNLKADKENNESKLNHIQNELKVEKEVSSKNTEENSVQINSLQNELQITTQIKQELSQKDKINTQKINDLVSQLNHLQEEIELLYRQNNSINEENGNQREEIGIANMKIYQLANEKEILQSELMRLEKQYNNDIRFSNANKEENAVLKSRVEELNRALNLTNENSRDYQIRSQNYEYEIQKLTQNLKQYQEEAEKERFARLRIGEDLKYKTQKNEECERELQNLYMSIENCLRSVPKKFECKTIYSLQAYIKESEEELNQLTRKLYSTTQELDLVTRKLNEISSEQICQQSKEVQMMSQIEAIYKENTYFKDNMKSLQEEVKSLHEHIQSLQLENTTLREQEKHLDYELSQIRRAIDSSGITNRTLEEKINLLNNEKTQLQNLITRIQRTMGASELQRIYFELIRIKGDLEISEREKIRLDSQLLRMEREENSNLVQKETLKAKIKSCETQIYSFKRKIQTLEEELNLEEANCKTKVNDYSLDNIRTVKKTLNYPESARNTPSRFLRNEPMDRSKSPFTPKLSESPEKYRNYQY